MIGRVLACLRAQLRSRRQARTLDSVIIAMASGANPTITVGGSRYPVNWIQAYMVVSEVLVKDFAATEGLPANEWGLGGEEQARPDCRMDR
mgnify:CR=1 FL=1